MKVNDDELLLVLHLACLTEDRTPDEQRALLHLALKLDAERSSFACGRTGVPPTMVWHVEQTYAPSEGRKIGLTGAQRQQLGRIAAKFDECMTCGVIRGRHAIECLAADIETFHAEQSP